MNAHNEQQWPEYLMLRDTGLADDAGGLGQRIFTTAGAGYVKQKYVRADIAAQPAAVQEAVGWQFWHEMPGGGGEWRNGSPDHVVKNHRKNTEAAGIPTRDVYAAPVTAAPARPSALTASIARLDAFLDGDCVEPLTLAQSEAAALVLQELKRRMASTLAAPGIDLTPFRAPLVAAVRLLARHGSEADMNRVADLIALIDASPKGGSHAIDHAGAAIVPAGARIAALEAEVAGLRNGIERAMGEIDDDGPKALKYARQELQAALQTSDAEVRT
ncbi:hypothetical protein H7691_12620 [Stenotrophomonas sp. CW117]|uniref:hypothetical protein n=1 Tax=Stenotrophomonas TaxID=40323 RepID=UPI0007034A73|nr:MULTISPECIES: hypothetical protein [Stenotrophomonas]KRG86146.1 hypothetical protein ABB33_04975 [Stenotrophomonas acidaminiphila]QOF97478.1 hypothetical protein H7691_12620 [Stenotrophomonas sp. CW117]